MRLNKIVLNGVIVMSLVSCTKVKINSINGVLKMDKTYEQYIELKTVDIKIPKDKNRINFELSDGSEVIQQYANLYNPVTNSLDSGISELIYPTKKDPFVVTYKLYNLDIINLEEKYSSLKNVLIANRQEFDKNGKLIKEEPVKKKNTSHKSILKLLDSLDYIDLKTVTVNKDFFPNFQLDFYENKEEASFIGLNTEEKEIFFKQEKVQKYYTKSTKFWVATFERVDRVEKAIHTIFIDDRTGELIDCPVQTVKRTSAIKNK